MPSTNAVFNLFYYVVWAGDFIFLNFVVSKFPNFVVVDCNLKGHDCLNLLVMGRVRQIVIGGDKVFYHMEGDRFGFKD